MSTFVQDFRYGARMLLRSPGFTLIAAGTLALGIGANTAIFSVVNALLLRPLPYPASDRLVMVWQDMRGRGGPATEWATTGNFVDWRNSGLFSSITAVQGWQPSLTGHGEAEPLVGEQVTEQYFTVLGVQPERGRAFTPDEDLPDAPRVVVLSHALWQRRFGGDPTIVGRSVTLGGEPHQVIGVMPPGFRPAVISLAEVWRPRRLNLVTASRGAVVLRVVGRLHAGLSLEQATSSAGVLATRLEAAHPDFNARVGINIVSLHRQVVGDIQSGLLVLLAAVASVLLIACANIANLLLARASARAREIAVRLALGAARRRLVQQLLTESVLLAATGGGLGVLLGVWGIDALVAIAPQGAPRLEEIRLDGAVLAFAIGLTAVTGVVFGIVPALQASKADVTPALREGGRGTSGSPTYRTRRALIVLEVAAAVVLLVGSGLLLRTLYRLQAFDLGFNPHGVLVGAVLPPRVAYPEPARQIAFYDRLLERVSALPGVETASLSSIVPLGGDSDMNVQVEGRAPQNEADQLAVWYRLVSAAYFRAMSIPLKAGRLFEPREAAPAVIVSEPAARRFWTGESAIGKRVRFGTDGAAPWFTVVGVVGEVHMRGPRGGSRNEVYLPYWQFPELGTNVILKATSRPELLVPALRQAVRDVDPNTPVASVATMSQIVADSIDVPRFFAALVAVFAVVAFALAIVGVYGLVAYSVGRRTPEIGVRMALGAGRRDVFALVVSDGLKLAAAGAIVGMAAAVGVSYSIRALLFAVEPLDPLTFAGVTVSLMLASMAACVWPAHRASRIDPMVVLRSE